MSVSRFDTVRNIIGLVKKLNEGVLPKDYKFELEVRGSKFDHLKIIDLNKTKTIKENQTGI